MGLIITVITALSIAALVSYPIVRRLGPRGFYFGAFSLGVAFIAIIPMHSLARDYYFETIPWIPQLQLELSFRLTGFTYAFALLVLGVGALVMLYSRWYFSDTDTGLARFSAVFLAFAVAMLGLVLADNVYLLFIFWEVTTILSFMLIGQHHKQHVARSAAFQALTVTTLGGLAMLVGFVVIAVDTETVSLTQLLETIDHSAVSTQISIFLILIGAITKSAIFPFHFWLPAAMAAPTPVSAYLHAAAMVKAGVFLLALFGPVIAEIEWLRAIAVIAGAITMILGALRALRQKDLKLLVAQGTVSQLGMLFMLFGLADAQLSFAATILLFAHAIAKAPLFLSVGIIDHTYGSRDIGILSGIGRQNKLLAIIATLAAASMAGVPVLFGFVAKELTLAELFRLTRSDLLADLALIIFIIGSILTVAYMSRYLWGAFASKHALVASIPQHRLQKPILIAPGILVLVALLGGIGASGLQLIIAPFTHGRPEIALWHGFTLPLFVSAGIILLGAFLFKVALGLERVVPQYPEKATASHIYWLFTRFLDFGALRLTRLTQRGSLPFYLSLMFVTFTGMSFWLLSIPGTWPSELKLMDSWVQIPIALIILVSAVRAAQSKTRFKAVILVGVIGYSMAAIFALHGAPDLALTQALVETISLIAFILVIRRFPINIVTPFNKLNRVFRAILASVIALSIGVIALIALGSRTADSVSEVFGGLAVEGGHGLNIVNVILVDIRGWDTLGELSVVLAAATGVASLVFLSTRGDNLPKLGRREARTQVQKHLRKVADPNDATSNAQWLLAGMSLDPRNRSIILEVVVRIIFHALMIVSVYLLLTGHNTPGGGFTGGLVAGLALVARYLAGGRTELGATVTLDAGRILGAGLSFAVLTALVPLFFGEAALTSSWVDLNLGFLGEISIVTSTFFDVGVYLVVFGLVLDVLRSLGAEIDEHIDQGSKV